MSRLDDVEVRAGAATSGPWRADLSQLDDVVVWAGEPATSEIVVNVGAKVQLIGEVFPRDSANGEFIAHAREDVPWLVGLVRQLVDALRSCPGATDDEGTHLKECESVRLGELPGSCVSCNCHVAKIREALARVDRPIEPTGEKR